MSTCVVLRASHTEANGRCTGVRDAALVAARDAQRRTGQPQGGGDEGRERQVQRGSHKDPLLPGRVRQVSR